MKALFNRLLTAFFAILFCFSLFSCSSPGSDLTVEIESFSPTKNIAASVISNSADMLYIYENAGELSAVSPIIVIGKVVDINYSDTNARPTTLYDFQISEVVRGDFSVNDIISVEEYGGYMRGDVYTKRFGSEHFTAPLTSKDMIEFSYRCGSPAPKVGDKYILFIGASDIIEGAYSIIGAYMGKYILDGNNAFRYDPDANLSSYSSRSSSSEKVSDVLSEIESVPYNAALFNERFGN